jgi:hypothetical protein
MTALTVLCAVGALICLSCGWQLWYAVLTLLAIVSVLLARPPRP